MPKRDIVSIECDYCGNYDTFSVTDPAEQVLPIISKWRGVMEGDAPPDRGAAGLRWYDSLECLIAGEKALTAKRTEEAQARAEEDRVLRKANQAMDRQVVVGKA